MDDFSALIHVISLQSFQTGRTGVYLDKSVVFFPTTKAGASSTAKVEVKNRTERTVALRCSKLAGGPFSHAVQGGSNSTDKLSHLEH